MAEPWKIPNSPWKDEKAYLNWLRGSIRRIWSRHPVKIAYKQQRRYKAPIGLKGKEVWCSDCEMCGKQSRTCEVDHLEGGYGFKDWQTFTEWARMILWVTFDDIRELCEECHADVTLSQKLGISLTDAKVEKKVIAITKQSAKLIDTFLAENGVTGCAKNPTARRNAVRGVLLAQRQQEKEDEIDK